MKKYRYKVTYNIGLVLVLSGLFALCLKAQLKSLNNKINLPIGIVQGGTCCCGNFTELSFPNLDFEEGTSPPIGGFITYGSGSVFAGWRVTRATIDHVEGSHANLGNGNPNGATNFIDLHGSPGFGGISYMLTGLTAGNNYRIDFWTAQNGSGHSSTGTLQIAGGAWLDVSWTVTISGAIAWFKQSYMFIAQGPTAEMEFSSVGDLIYAGTLVDDIKIFECPADKEQPMILNEPLNEIYSCLKDVPPPPGLQISDNCDPNPVVKLKTTTQKIDDCEQILLREWTITDKCGNTKILNQEIIIKDEEAPKIITPPKDKIVDCKTHSKNTFLSWVSSSGGASVKDNCGKVYFSAQYDSIPTKPCDTMTVYFIALDDCNNETYFSAHYIISDAVKPSLIKPASTVLLQCSSLARDSLRRWLMQNGNAEAIDECSNLNWKNNFNGDSFALDITVEFTATDRCGNFIKTSASFKQEDASDTSYVVKYVCGGKVTKQDTQTYFLPGCDSVVITNNVGVIIDTTFIRRMTCDRNLPAIQLEILSSHLTCDSVIVYLNQYVKPDSLLIIQYDCLSLDTSFNYISFPDQPCDSVVIIQTNPAVKNYNENIFFTCDSNEVRKDSSFFKNIYGCDSIVINLFKYNAKKFTYRDTAICGIFLSFQDTVTISTNFCDSLVITRFNPLKRDSVFIKERTCDPLKEGTFVYNLTNIFGCDSILIKEISLQKADTSIIQKFTCLGTIPKQDTIYFQVNGKCDSVVIVNYLDASIDTLFINSRTCDPTQAGIKVERFNGVYCDSIVVFRTTLEKSYLENRITSTCFKDSVGMDTLSLQSLYGCDSVIIQEIKYLPVEIEWTIEDVSCYQAHDGKIILNNLRNVTLPVQFMLNGIVLNDLTGLEGLQAGQYSFFIRDSRMCISDTINIHIVEPELLKVDAGKDQEMDKPDLINLNALTNRPVIRYHWYPEDLFNCKECPSTSVNVKENLKIYVNVIDSNGCEATDTVNFIIREGGEIYFPKIFSPNSDGINDGFTLFGNPGTNVILLRIYDRWGELIFEKENFGTNNEYEGWDGTYKGNEISPGVYVFYTEIELLDGTRRTITGDITLVR